MNHRRGQSVALTVPVHPGYEFTRSEYKWRGKSYTLTYGSVIDAMDGSKLLSTSIAYLWRQRLDAILHVKRQAVSRD